MAGSLYDSIVDVIEYYLGPAATRFVDRQIEFHLQKPPREVAVEDLPKLTNWMMVSMALLTDDSTMIDECNQKLSKLIL